MIRFHESLLPLLTPADKVRPHPQNANNGDIDEIVASITVNGCYRPVYANKETGYIVAGHHLYAALLELGAEEIPVLWLDGNDEETVRILLADNRIAALAKMDDGLLVDLLKSIEQTDIGLLGTGYDEAYLERLSRDDAVDEWQPLPETPEDFNNRTIECPNCGHVIGKGKS